MKLTLIGRPVIPADQMDRNITHARSLGLPTYKDRAGSRSGPLSIIGGGPSARKFVETARNGFVGDVWAVNGTCSWLREEGYDPVFFSCDALPMVSDFAKGARRAVIAEQCDPSVYDVLLEGGAEVITFDCRHGEVVGTGSTTATATPVVAVRLGHAPLIFYGCEGNYERGKTHADRHEPRAEEMIVEVGGQHYLTAPDFLQQCEELAGMFHMEQQHGKPGFPVFQEESGGLLRAMIEHGADYDIKWLSPAMADNIASTMKGLAA